MAAIRKLMNPQNIPQTTELKTASRMTVPSQTQKPEKTKLRRASTDSMVKRSKEV